MMRRALIPHKACGVAPVFGRRCRRLGRVSALAMLSVLIALLAFLAAHLQSAQAQDPSLRLPQVPKSSFPKTPGGIFGPKPKIDRAQPLYMQADQLIYDTKTNRVIAQGNVEIYYNNFILTSDQVIYDQNLNKLIAEGNAQLKDPTARLRAPTGSRRSTISAMRSSNP